MGLICMLHGPNSNQGSDYIVISVSLIVGFQSQNVKIRCDHSVQINLFSQISFIYCKKFDIWKIQKK